MGKQLVFVDDSGDPGLKNTSSNNFVIAAALFINPRAAEALSEQISRYRKSLGWRDDYEFKFAKIRKDIVVEVLRMSVGYDFKIYAVYVDKSSFRQIGATIDKEKLYNWTIKELLSIVPLKNAKIEIDGRSSRQNMNRTASYLRHEINIDGTRKLDIRFENSTKDNLIQLADLIAGSINRSMNMDKTDSKTYIDIIRGKISEIKRIDQR
ncbi:DUF3800 domain-containing protein [Candidatus Saccharibacteria bacterium]|nr:DUF3800 domain-containing protein [Candidatus Saccharibacteria bacterium]